MDSQAQSPGKKPRRRELTMATVEKVKDPVCGMMVEPSQAAATFNHKGQSFYFCHPRCQERFQADPEGYLAGRHQMSMGEGITKPGATYVCPMCPEVASDKPSACPSCGMALEPSSVSLGYDQNSVHLSHGSGSGSGSPRDLSEVRDGSGISNRHSGG